ncbi:MAG TPA: murein biosynthesis integral membrane protein MurJ [Propionibacteriaceae bacterium]|nr:murein biosynthesis integral membrane protein MurJ [Propionibacteriaceae bacterium]
MSETSTPKISSPGIANDPGPTTEERRQTRRLVSASVLMASGTALSRVLGFFRLMLLVYLFGNGTRQAEMFTIATNVPNSMYILLAGGVLNTVLVPQIVRAIRGDADRGEAYTNRIMTAGLIALGLITLLLTLAVPWIISLYSAAGWKSPQLEAQYQSMIMLGYYCMPQVFFYGVHVLAGQVLNARDRFGPMMWAPIANNVVSIIVLLMYLIVFERTSTGAPFTAGQELLLGIGSTLGIAAQAAVLIPFLRASGYHYRPRFDFKHTGLGKTFRLAKWTLGFVLVTQAALVVVSKLATSATVGGKGAGLTAYSNAYAMWILPHSLITVSLATAMLPTASRLAAAGDLPAVASETMRAIRLAVTALLPAAVAFLVLGLPLAHLIFGFGQGSKDASYVGGALMALAIGLVPFTVQYICLRAFYALEDNRTTFFLQCLIAGSNVILGVAAVLLLDNPALVATGLALSYSAAYLIGLPISFSVLRRKLPDLDSEQLIRHCVRLLLAVIPAAIAAWLIAWAVLTQWESKVVLAFGLAVAGLVAVGLFLLMARLIQIHEVREIITTVLRRGSDYSPEARQQREESVIEASADRFGEFKSSGDSPTVIRPPSPSIEEAVEENAGPMAQATAAEGVGRDVGPDVGPDVGQSAGSSAQPSVVDGAAQTAAPTAGPSTEPAAEGSGDGPSAAILPAGTVLASRYRLEELIAESEPSVTWRAFDQVLSRSVLVHLLAPGDAREDELLTAARKASVATDSRFLRVLDAVHSTDPAVGSYIVCEYATGQSLEMILSHGPLSGLEAAWVTREIADALAGVHSLGLYHRRLNPETVIITPSGNIKIVGLMIEATLRPRSNNTVPGAISPEQVDVTDLGRLLYASLVCRWPGGPAFGLPAAPMVGRRWMTPRQVRAGVSLALDNVSDQILGDPPRHHAPAITTAGGIVTALTKVLGSADAAPDLERRLHQPVPNVPGSAEPPDGAATAQPVSSLLDTTTARQRAITTRMVPAATAPPTTGRSTAARSSAARSTGAPPTVQTRVRPGAPRSSPTTPPRPPQAGPPGRSTAAPQRRRRWIGLLLVLAVLLIAAAIISALILDRQISAGPEPTPSADKTSKTSDRAPTRESKLTIAAAQDFDPQGEDKTENPNEVKFAYDGDPSTRWRTVQYFGNPKLGNIKRGVGLVLDLDSPQQVRSLRITLSGSGTSVQFRVPKSDPSQTAKPPMSSDRLWRTVAAESKAGGSATLTPTQDVTTRYVLVYLTSLPKEGSGYRGGIYEVEVLA